MNKKRDSLMYWLEEWSDNNYGSSDWILHHVKFSQNDDAGLFLVQSFEYDRVAIVYIYGKNIDGDIMYSLEKSVKTPNKEMVEIAKEIFDAISHRTILK